MCMSTAGKWPLHCLLIAISVFALSALIVLV
jgi:hypothetical protein